jgi:hypothetical protein
MIASDLEFIKKYFRKNQKSWSESELEFHAQRVLDNYLSVNKDRLMDLDARDKAEFEKALDLEFLNLYLDKK